MPPRKRASRQPSDGVELADLPPIAPAPVTESGDGPVMMIGAPMTAADARAERELDDLLQEIGTGDVTVNVRRRSPTGAMQSCGTMPAKDFTVDALTDAFGGGSYSLRFMRGRSEVGRTTVDVDPLIPPKNPRAPGAVPAAPAPGSAPEMMTMMTGVIGVMMQTMQASQAATLTMISGMAEMMKASRPTENPTEIALRIAEMMKGGNDKAPSVTDLFGILEKGMNLGAKMNGGDDSDGVMPMVGEGVKGVVALMEGIAAEKKATAARLSAETPVASAAPVAIPSGQPVAVVAPPVPAPATMTTARPWVAAVLPFKDQLAGMIGMFSPSFVAPMLLEKMSDEQLDDLLNDIEDQTEPGFVLRTWMLLRPGVAATQQQVQWLADVAAAIVESTESEEEPEGGESGGGGGTTNAAVTE